MRIILDLNWRIIMLQKKKFLIGILFIVSIGFLSTIPIGLYSSKTQIESTLSKLENLRLSFEVAWIPNGTVISNATAFQEQPQICSDGARGAIITWRDTRDEITTEEDIYVQKIDSNGIVQWTPNGTALCTADNMQETPKICSDEAGGAIITWYDNRGTVGDIYAQKIDSNGIVQWTPNGMAICIEIGNQRDPQICSDGAGGAIIAWRDGRGATQDIYAQKIDSNGIVQWTPNGIAICSADQNQEDPLICSDNNGGAIIVWRDLRNMGSTLTDIYAQRIDSNGIIQWTPNGTVICTAVAHQDLPHLSSDGEGGALITWRDDRNIPLTDRDIYAQKIDLNGVVQWTPNGTAVCTETFNQRYPRICNDGDGGAIIAWLDFRGGLNWDIYTQKIDSNGDIQWIPNGTAICTIDALRERPQICSNEAGGAIITWYDSRGTTYDIFAQRIDSNGDIQWTANGTAVCTANNHQRYPQICSDGDGGAIITWQDWRTDIDVYAQRIKDALPSKKGEVIPFGNYYLLFIILSVISLLILQKHKR